MSTNRKSSTPALTRRETWTERATLGLVTLGVLAAGVYLVRDFQAALHDGRFSGNRIAALEADLAPRGARRSASAEATAEDGAP